MLDARGEEGSAQTAKGGTEGLLCSKRYVREEPEHKRQQVLPSEV